MSWQAGAECVDWLRAATELTGKAAVQLQPPPTQADSSSSGAATRLKQTAIASISGVGEDGEGQHAGKAAATLLRGAETLSQQLTDAILSATEASVGVDGA